MLRTISNKCPTCKVWKLGKMIPKLLINFQQLHTNSSGKNEFLSCSCALSGKVKFLKHINYTFKENSTTFEPMTAFIFGSFQYGEPTNPQTPFKPFPRVHRKCQPAMFDFLTLTPRRGGRSSRGSSLFFLSFSVMTPTPLKQLAL